MIETLKKLINKKTGIFLIIISIIVWLIQTITFIVGVSAYGSATKGDGQMNALVTGIATLGITDLIFDWLWETLIDIAILIVGILVCKFCDLENEKNVSKEVKVFIPPQQVNQNKNYIVSKPTQTSPINQSNHINESKPTQHNNYIVNKPTQNKNYIVSKPKQTVFSLNEKGDCPVCGSNNKKDAEKCWYCGAKFKD